MAHNSSLSRSLAFAPSGPCTVYFRVLWLGKKPTCAFLMLLSVPTSLIFAVFWGSDGGLKAGHPDTLSYCPKRRTTSGEKARQRRDSGEWRVRGSCTAGRGRGVGVDCTPRAALSTSHTYWHDLLRCIKHLSLYNLQTSHGHSRTTVISCVFSRSHQAPPASSHLHQPGSSAALGRRCSVPLRADVTETREKRLTSTKHHGTPVHRAFATWAA